MGIEGRGGKNYSQSWESGSPPTGGAGRMKLSCVVPASVIHI